MNALGLDGRYHDRYGEKSMHAQRETQSIMGEPLRRWRVSYEAEGMGNREQFVQGLLHGQKVDRTTGFRKYEAGKQGLETLIWVQPRWTVVGS